jgi:chemosensory pili system protein ChpA (sensor histidine kinase/response regulator)
VFQLWWVVGAIVEALREGGLETGVSIKRLMGLADREILQLYTQGEGRYAQNPPVELLNNLLYYAARATSNGPKVTAVRASFRLNELLMVDDSVEQERENLSAPSVKLMRTGGGGHSRGPRQGQGRLDIYVRRGGQPAELEAQVGMLRKIGDTLGVLGLGELRQLVLERPAASKPWPPARRLRITPRWCTSPQRSSMSKTGWTATSSASSCRRRRRKIRRIRRR